MPCQQSLDGVGAQAAAMDVGEQLCRAALPRILEPRLERVAVCVVSGVERSLRPLPRHRTYAPVPKTTALRSSWMISDSRSPVCAARWSSM
jgi:hypothetical protein